MCQISYFTTAPIIYFKKVFPVESRKRKDNSMCLFIYIFLCHIYDILICFYFTYHLRYHAEYHMYLTDVTRKHFFVDSLDL